MRWKLLRTDTGSIPTRVGEYPSADRCKEIACQHRRIVDDSGWEYNHSMQFAIYGPDGKLWARTADTSGWRLKWGYV